MSLLELAQHIQKIVSNNRPSLHDGRYTTWCTSAAARGYLERPRKVLRLHNTTLVHRNAWLEIERRLLMASSKQVPGAVLPWRWYSRWVHRRKEKYRGRNLSCIRSMRDGRAVKQRRLNSNYRMPLPYGGDNDQKTESWGWCGPDNLWAARIRLLNVGVVSVIIAYACLVFRSRGFDRFYRASMTYQFAGDVVG